MIPSNEDNSKFFGNELLKACSWTLLAAYIRLTQSLGRVWLNIFSFSARKVVTGVLPHC